MAGMIEEGDPGPAPGGIVSWTVSSDSAPAGWAEELNAEVLSDRLRFMGIEEGIVVGFEARAAEDLAAAIGWLHEQLPDDEPEEWRCDCGELLVEREWRGRATGVCAECGARWGVEVTGGGEGGIWNLSGPSDAWRAAHPIEEELAYGDHQPEEERQVPGPGRDPRCSGRCASG